MADLTRFVDFNIKGRDVIVFLHIQKTGGTTFGRHLVKNIRLEQPCSCKAGQKKCTCHRPGKKETWLFSRFSTGWSCGLHADWTELTNCVPAIMEKKDCPRNHSHTRWDPCNTVKNQVACKEGRTDSDGVECELEGCYRGGEKERKSRQSEE
ncbi:hypothetical protein CB1_001525021 [Camelus ferus]|nr:hypothetical protein CB1_001525021 [Camelus ferus]